MVRKLGKFLGIAGAEKGRKAGAGLRVQEENEDEVRDKPRRPRGRQPAQRTPRAGWG